jgi:hypothetical protein
MYDTSDIYSFRSARKLVSVLLQVVYLKANDLDGGSTLFNMKAAAAGDNRILVLAWVLYTA